MGVAQGNWPKKEYLGPKEIFFKKERVPQIPKEKCKGKCVPVESKIPSKRNFCAQINNKPKINSPS